MQFYPISKPSITKLEKSFMSDAIESEWISSLGKYIDLFEDSFAEFSGVKYAVAVANGTCAIQLSLLAAGVGPGDDVLVPDFTFIATANAVKHVGANPIFVDIDPDNLCIDCIDASKKITPHTKAMIPVHLYGHPANMDEIAAFAKQYNLAIIEDCAESHGARFRGKTVGGIGDFGTFSFYGNKIFTTGEGGVVTTNSLSARDHVRNLRDHAMSPTKRYWHTEVGFNFRMTNVQAALGCAQLQRATEILEKRSIIREAYHRRLNTSICKTPQTADWASPTHWMTCVQIKGLKDDSRNKLMQLLKSKNVDSRPYFYPISDMPPYKTDANTPVTHEVYETGINLPTYTDLEVGDVNVICDIFLSTVEELNL